MNTPYIRFKSAFDRFLSIILIVLFLPVIILIGVMIVFDSGGPIIFSQIRLGKNKRKFVFYKFRTMYADAHKKYPKLYKYKYSKKDIKTMKFKPENDPRLTPFGKYLRHTSLDELPNLINVIKGEMNLIGPRPEIPQMLPYYNRDQLKKFSIKPGITGIAQVEGRGLLSFQETIKYDIYYSENQNLLLDMKILLKTVLVVFRGTGAF